MKKKPTRALLTLFCATFILSGCGKTELEPRAQNSQKQKDYSLIESYGYDITDISENDDYYIVGESILLPKENLEDYLNENPLISPSYSKGLTCTLLEGKIRHNERFYMYFNYFDMLITSFKIYNSDTGELMKRDGSNPDYKLEGGNKNNHFYITILNTDIDRIYFLIEFAKDWECQSIDYVVLTNFWSLYISSSIKPIKGSTTPIPFTLKTVGTAEIKTINWTSPDNSAKILSGNGTTQITAIPNSNFSLMKLNVQVSSMDGHLFNASYSADVLKNYPDVTTSHKVVTPGTTLTFTSKAPVTGASYEWKIPAGCVIESQNGGTIRIKFPTLGTYQIMCRYIYNGYTSLYSSCAVKVSRDLGVDPPIGIGPAD